MILNVFSWLSSHLYHLCDVWEMDSWNPISASCGCRAKHCWPHSHKEVALLLCSWIPWFRNLDTDQQRRFASVLQHLGVSVGETRTGEGSRIICLKAWLSRGNWESELRSSRMAGSLPIVPPPHLPHCLLSPSFKGHLVSYFGYYHNLAYDWLSTFK